MSKLVKGPKTHKVKKHMSLVQSSLRKSITDMNHSRTREVIEVLESR